MFNFIRIAGDISAGLLFNKFNEKLNQPQTNKSTLRKIWGDIEKILPSIKSITDITAKLSPLLS